MRMPTAIRQKTIPFNLLIFLAAIPFVLVWLPLLRCLMDGSSYRWGQSYYGMSLASKGIEADLIFLVLQFIFYALLFFSFYRCKNRKLFYGLLALWFINVYGNFFHLLITQGDIPFHGDTLGVHTSLSRIVIPFALISLGLIIYVIRRDVTMEEQDIPWNKRNKIWLIGLLALIPIQWILFATGEAHGTTDGIGVILTIIQAFLLPFIFEPKP